MTIDERLSAEQFRALPADDPQASAALLAQLEEAVAVELHEAVSARMVQLLVETDDPAELERITDAVANIGCPLPVAEHDRCPTPWFVISTPLEHLDEDEAARWRDVLNRE